MKAIKQFLFYIVMGVLSLIGCSCEPEQIQTKEVSIHVSHDSVPKALVGNYESETKERITITPDWIEIGTETYFLSQYRTFDNKGCWYTIFLENGTEIRIKYKNIEHRFITVDAVKYYKQEKL